MSVEAITYRTGIPEDFRATAVALYDEAFGKKLSVAVRNDEARRQLLHKSLVLKYAIGAFTNEQLTGIAGFQTAEGSLTAGINYRRLLSELGLIKGNRAALIFSLYERKPKPGELVMDGISVRSDVRGHGIGSALLNEIINYAENDNYNSIRLDVIDTNPKARQLYERIGFKAIKTESFPLLRPLLRFGGVTTMVLRVNRNNCKLNES